MRWYKNLFFGENARKRAAKIVGKIKRGQFQPDVYVLTLPSGEQNLLEIYPSYILLQDYFKEQDLLIVGLACGYEEAGQLAASIVDQVYQNNGNVAVKEYLEKQE